MKYAYITATGKTEVEVDEQFYELLISMDHEEFNSDRKHSRRHAIALDDVEYEGVWFSDDTDLLGDLIREENRERLREALGQLTHAQRALIQQIYFEGVSPSEIARRNGVGNSAISHRLALAHKRLKKFFK